MQNVVGLRCLRCRGPIAFARFDMASQCGADILSKQNESIRSFVTTPNQSNKL
jgi:hypothetical protein